VAWFDTGTPESLHNAGSYVKTFVERTGFKISCPEEVAFRKEYIDRDQLINLSKLYGANEYGIYLMKIANSVNSN